MAFNLFKGIRVPKNGQNPPYESFLESRGFRPRFSPSMLIVAPT